MLLLLLTAAHAGSLEELASGTFTLADSAAEVTARREAAIEATLEPMNFALAMIARGKLEDTMAVCRTYEIRLDGQELYFRCDALNPVTATIGGGATPHTTDSGNVVQATATRPADEVIEISFAGESGGQTTRFDFSSGRLVVTKTVTSDMLEVPLTATFNY